MLTSYLLRLLVPIAIGTFAALLSRSILTLTRLLIAPLPAFLSLLTRALPTGLLARFRLILTTLPALLALIAIFLRLLIATFFVIARLAALIHIWISIVWIVRHNKNLLDGCGEMYELLLHSSG